MKISIYISSDEALNSKEARPLAIERAGPGLKVSSVMWNRSRGGWTFNFKEIPVKVLLGKSHTGSLANYLNGTED